MKMSQQSGQIVVVISEKMVLCPNTYDYQIQAVCA